MNKTLESCSMRKLSTSVIAFVTLLSLLFLYTTGAAFALDQQSIMKRFQSFSQENNIIFTFESANIDNGNNLTLKKVDIYDEKTEVREKIDNAVFSNIRQSVGGQITYDTLVLSGIISSVNIDGNLGKTSIQRVVMSGLKFSADSSAPVDPWPQEVANTDITNIAFKVDSSGTTLVAVFPSAKALNIKRTSLRNFIAQSIILEEGTGKSTEAGTQNSEFTLGAMSSKNVEFFGLRGFDIGLTTLAASTLNLENEEGKKINFLFEGAEIENLYSPDLTVDGKPLVSQKDLNAKIKPLTVTVDGVPVLSWKSGIGKTTTDPTTNILLSEARVEDLTIDLSSFPKDSQNSQALESLEALNLTTMVLDLNGQAKWNRNSGLVDITDYSITLEDGAAFSIAARLTGYTEEIATSFSRSMAQINLESDPQKKQALSLQAIASLADLTIERLEISIDDKSLLDRVIAFQATKFKQEPDQIKGIVGPMVNILLVPYNLPELAAQASAAMGTFMQGNKKLSIVLEPQNGIVVTEVIALVSAARAGRVDLPELVKRLNISVNAQ